MKNQIIKAIFKCLTVLLIAFNPFTNSYGQSPYDSLSVNYSYFPKKEFKELQGKTTINYVDVNLISPKIKLGSRTSFKNTLNYKMYQYNFEDLVAGWNNLPEQLHDIRYTLIFRHQFNEKWGLQASPRVNVRSDFKNGFTGVDFLPGITAFAIRTSQKNPNLKWGIGFSYNNDLDPNGIIPVVVLYYKSEKMRVNLLLPINGEIIMTPSKRFEYGFTFTNESAYYNIDNGNINSTEAKYLKNVSLLLSPTAYYNVTNNLWLNLKAGYILNTNYDVWNSDHEAANTSMENSFKSAPFVSAGISMRLNK